MTSNRKAIIAAVAVCAVLIAAFAFAFQGTANAANPQPLEIPTPVAGVVHSGVNSGVATFFQTVVLTQDTFSNLQNVEDHAKTDIQWITDQTAVAGAPNTTTLTLQYSNDGTNWVNGPAVVSSSATDANDMSQLSLFGRYARINADVANANPVTLTVIGVAK
jgi:hypothetical protein